MGSGYRTFTAGEVLTASNVQNYLQDQAVMVFAGTAARSSAIGTANFEEGMLTYLTDVDKLQVYTGATFADVYPAAASTQGLTLINTTSFSGVASQALTASTFTSTYDEYKIFLTISSNTADAQIYVKLRASGVDSSTNYNFANLIITTGAVASNGTSAGNTLGQFIGRMDAGRTDACFFEFSIAKPFLATATTFTGTGVGSTDAGVVEGGTIIGCHTTATSYDSINVIASSGNFTGVIKVYGVNK